jgi:hypothetical protein
MLVQENSQRQVGQRRLRGDPLLLAAGRDSRQNVAAA